MQIYNVTYILINYSPFYHLSIIAAPLFKFCYLFGKRKLNAINSFRYVFLTAINGTGIDSIKQSPETDSISGVQELLHAYGALMSIPVFIEDSH
jgi:hypothetical protein